MFKLIHGLYIYFFIKNVKVTLSKVNSHSTQKKYFKKNLQVGLHLKNYECDLKLTRRTFTNFFL